MSVGGVRLAGVPEAPMRTSRNGLVVVGDGWFVVNARESRWKDEGPLGAYCTFARRRRKRSSFSPANAR